MSDNQEIIMNKISLLQNNYQIKPYIRKCIYCHSKPESGNEFDRGIRVTKNEQVSKDKYALKNLTSLRILFI
jgi:hypothetical protein